MGRELVTLCARGEMERVACCTHHPTEEAAAGLALSAGFTLWGSAVSFITDETFCFFKRRQGECLLKDSEG